MTAPILEITNLYKSFGALPACAGIDMSVEAGTVHALIGPNGAGKTTLANLISGQLLPDSGAIVFCGADITRLKPDLRARQGLARSFQIISIFEHLSVAENMALSILAHAGHNFRFFKNGCSASVVRTHLEPCLARVGLVERAALVAGHLSHGEKRQLEVGMALSGQPQLLILDEPMAGMGPGGTVEMSKLIKTLGQEMTVILVEHDMKVVFSLADQITVLVCGTAIAHGTPAQIKEHDQVRSAYLGDDGSCWQ